MKIRMRTTAAGPAGVYQANKEVPVPDEIGERLIAGGYAELVEETPPEKAPEKESATAPPAPETAAMDPPPRRRKKDA